MSEPEVVKAPDANVEAVRQALLDRSLHGLKKYGVTTEREDLTLLQWLQHLQEELMDATVYIEAFKRQHAHPPRLFVQAGALTPEDIAALIKPGAIIEIAPRE